MTAETSNARGDVVAWFPTNGRGEIIRTYGDGSPVYACRTKEEAEQAKRCHLGATGPVIPLYAAPPLLARVPFTVERPAAQQQQGQESGGEVIQRHVVTKYRDGSVHVADVAAAECPHDWGQDEAHDDWARCYKCGISRRKPLAQQPAAVDEAAAIRAFEEHFQASSDDPYFEGELELWLTAWRKALADQQQELKS